MKVCCGKHGIWCPCPRTCPCWRMGDCDDGGLRAKAKWDRERKKRTARRA